MGHTQASAGVLLVETEGALRMVASHGLRGPTDLGQSDHVRAALRTGRRQRVLLPQDLTVEGVLADFKPREVLVGPVMHKLENPAPAGQSVKLWSFRPPGKVGEFSPLNYLCHQGPLAGDLTQESPLAKTSIMSHEL